MRLCSLASVLLLLSLAHVVFAQDAKTASVLVVNATDDERTVEINKSQFKIKPKSQKTVTIPAGDFTYKVVGFDDAAVTRTVKAGETWAMTLRAKVTILPGDKDLPPKVTKTDEKVKSDEKLDWDQSKQARIVLVLPNADTTVTVDDKTMPKNENLKRFLLTPSLGKNLGQTWFYVISATWTDDGVKKSQTYKVTFQCGDDVTVDFTKPPPPLVYRPMYYYPPPMYYRPSCGWR